jgi:hypothetical protein
MTARDGFAVTLALRALLELLADLCTNRIWHLEASAAKRSGISAIPLRWLPVSTADHGGEVPSAHAF